jgi:hypothetical protein
MPKIQVVVNQEGKILYIGYDRDKAYEMFLDYHTVELWYETDDDTEIDLKIGDEDETPL